MLYTGVLWHMSHTNYIGMLHTVHVKKVAANNSYIRPVKVSVDREGQLNHPQVRAHCEVHIG